jgi:hypothetical protein
MEEPLAAGPYLPAVPYRAVGAPAFTAPLRLADEAVGPKRKKQHTRYVKAVEDGELVESQYAKISRR